MHQVAHYYQFACLVRRMSGSVSDCINGNHVARERVAEFEQMQMSLVGIHGLYNLGVLCSGHIHPRFIFRFRCIYFRVGEDNAVAFHHATDVVSMEMREIQVSDVCGLCSQRFQVGNEPAVIPLEDLDDAEKLEVLDGGADPFFTRASYNKTDVNQAGLPGMEAPAAEQEEAASQMPSDLPQQAPVQEQTVLPVDAPAQETLSQKELEQQLTEQALEIENRQKEQAAVPGDAEEDN